MESVLIIVLPETRGYDLTFDSFKTNFLENFIDFVKFAILRLSL
jgi:hypothetical protein